MSKMCFHSDQYHYYQEAYGNAHAPRWYPGVAQLSYGQRMVLYARRLVQPLGIGETVYSDRQRQMILERPEPPLEAVVTDLERDSHSHENPTQDNTSDDLRRAPWSGHGNY